MLRLHPLFLRLLLWLPLRFRRLPRHLLHLPVFLRLLRLHAHCFLSPQLPEHLKARGFTPHTLSHFLCEDQKFHNEALAAAPAPAPPPPPAVGPERPTKARRGGPSKDIRSFTCKANREDDDIGMHVASDLPTLMNIECMSQSTKENVSSGSNEREEKK